MKSPIKTTGEKSPAQGNDSLSETRRLKSSRAPHSTHDHIMFLQRTIGNQAVERLFESGAIQAKLRIGQPGDVYEQEADRVADAVMRMPEPPHIRRQEEEEEEEELIQTKTAQEKITPLVQRQAEEEEEEELVQPKPVSSQTPGTSSNLEAHKKTLQGGGRPLPHPMRTFFEKRFGCDFSKVRLHTDTQATESAKALNARAYTVGRDIVFGGGHYAPDTSPGRRLLAHELTHVVQQKGIVSQAHQSPNAGSAARTNTDSTVSLPAHSRARSAELVQRAEAEEAPSEEKILEDLETATKDVKKYMDYITECAKRSKEYGVPLPEEIKKAAERIMEISQSISSKLKLLGTAIETVQQGLDWAKGICAVARDITSLKLGDKASLESLLESIDMLNKASKPAQTWVESLGTKGVAAARFSFIFSVVVAQAEIGLGALRKGIEHLRAGEERTRKRIESEEKSTERRMKIPPPPAFPKTAAEEEAAWKAIKEQERVLSERNVELMFKQKFIEEEFPRKNNYPRYRGEIKNQVLRALLARQKKSRVFTAETAAEHEPEEKWWDCLTPGNEDARDFGGGIYLYPRKPSIDFEDAFWEIRCFKTVQPPCPFFDALYDLAYEEFRSREYEKFARGILSR